MKQEWVSWCFELSQPLRIISGLRWPSLKFVNVNWISQLCVGRHPSFSADSSQRQRACGWSWHLPAHRSWQWSKWEQSEQSAGLLSIVTAWPRLAVCDWFRKKGKGKWLVDDKAVESRLSSQLDCSALSWNDLVEHSVIDSSERKMTCWWQPVVSGPPDCSALFWGDLV